MSRYSVCPDPSSYNDDYGWHSGGYDVTEVEEPWENDDEWADAELPLPTMEDERRGLMLAHEMEYRRAQAQPEAAEDEMLARLRIAAGVTRQQAAFEFEYLAVA